MDPYWTQILGRDFRNRLRNMVGTRRLELLTSTVSNLKPLRDDVTPKKSE